MTGKIGTDIQDGKCSWLIVVAMQRATRDQKNVLRVIKFYIELRLADIFSFLIRPVLEFGFETPVMTSLSLLSKEIGIVRTSEFLQLTK